VRDYIHNGFKVGPNYHTPPAAVAPTWIDAPDRRVAMAEPDCRAWWTVFHDPVLDTLVQSAYQQNLSLREAGFRVLEARAQRAVAVGNLFPQKQQAAASYTRNMVSTNVFNPGLIGSPALSSTAGGGSTGNFLPGGGALFPGRFFNIWDTEFDVSWELDLWGRFRRAVEAADATLSAAAAGYDDVLVTLVADVATNYIEFRTLQERLRLARENVAIQRRLVTIARARAKQVKGGLVDAAQMESQLAQTESLIPTLETSLRQANNKLCVLLGLPPQDLQEKLGAGPIPVAPAEVAVGIPGDLLRRSARRAPGRA
jgi:outer membrane protein TolC